jgi:mannonate dehydratase
MIETWRWFGPVDKITLSEVAQTGARGVVNALHEIPYGEVWTEEAIRERQAVIKAGSAQLDWMVVESLPVHEDIKRGAGDLDVLFGNYRQSMANLAKCGIRTICYNFMPLLDWTRTTLDAPVKNGGTALRFSALEMAAFELFVMGLKDAEAHYLPETITAAAIWHQSASSAAQSTLLSSIMAGLPGAYDRYSVDELKRALAAYTDLDRDGLRANYARFLREVIPAAQEYGINMCVHPDDPPRPLLGLPRIVSNQDDISWILSRETARENGLTLCSGSLGANPLNNVPEIAQLHADRIHFAHMRNVQKEADGSFQEAEHLDGDVDMVQLVRVLCEENADRAGTTKAPIYFRPDHGHELASDADRNTHPGYPLIGRLRGLAELRGVIAGLGY